MTLQHDYFELDLKGRRCPQTLIASKLAMGKLNIGDVLVILLDDSSSASDILDYAHRRGFSVNTIEPQRGLALMAIEITISQESRFHV
ncbi:sulfurtransferase TusA family protein [Corallincola holothuriorum]|uniref:Sulfurtransferase TusA family protein n=1 Tax=Corallincola holothuriorum TaxID=2282215 RepID=A0A368NKN7_9GAMM|nr:sulfurtransferase TusA family protein [Corallincola holothuriorum]